MARDNSIAVSDEELQQIKDIRMKIFNTDEVPYGETISHICSLVEDE